MTQLKALKASSKNAKLYAQVAVNRKLLEWFENPAKKITQDEDEAPAHDIWESIIVPEFTCLCPITGQPDFATIEIFYAPDFRCVESKALKLYLGSFRNTGNFHEQVATTICHDLYDMLIPKWILIVGRFTPRGGIPFHPRVSVGPVPQPLLYRI